VLPHSKLDETTLSEVRAWMLIGLSLTLFADHVTESGRRLQTSAESVSELVDVDALEDLVLVSEVRGWQYSSVVGDGVR